MALRAIQSLLQLLNLAAGAQNYPWTIHSPTKPIKPAPPSGGPGLARGPEQHSTSPRDYFLKSTLGENATWKLFALWARTLGPCRAQHCAGQVGCAAEQGGTNLPSQNFRPRREPGGGEGICTESNLVSGEGGARSDSLGTFNLAPEEMSFSAHLRRSVEEGTFRKVGEDSCSQPTEARECIPLEKRIEVRRGSNRNSERGTRERGNRSP